MALVFGEIHDWGSKPGVKQVLVFSCNKAEVYFNEKHKERLESTDGTYYVSTDSDCGAIFKLRAIKTSSGKYMPVVRCGITGYELIIDHRCFDGFEDAIDIAKELLFDYLKSN